MSSPNIQEPETPPLSEVEFLNHQVHLAHQGIRDALAGVRTSAAQAVDPRVWTHKHPLIALGSALVAGFAAAAVVTPSRSENLSEHFESLAEQLGFKAGVAGNGSSHVPPANKPRGLISSIVHEAAVLIRPVLISAVSGAVSARTASRSDADGRPGGGGAQAADDAPSSPADAG